LRALRTRISEIPEAALAAAVKRRAEQMPQINTPVQTGEVGYSLNDPSVDQEIGGGTVRLPTAQWG
jgi:hypothetical protein